MYDNVAPVSNPYLRTIQGGGTGSDIAMAVAADSGGSIYVAGHFTSPSITLGNTTLINTGPSNDIFISKISSTGLYLRTIQ